MGYYCMTAEMPYHDAEKGEVLTAERLHTGGAALFGRGREIACIPHKGCRLETLAAAESPHPAVNRLLPGEVILYRRRRQAWWQWGPTIEQLLWWGQLLFITIATALITVALLGFLSHDLTPSALLTGFSSLMMMVVASFVLGVIRQEYRDWLELPDGSIVRLKDLIGFKFQLLPAVATPPPVETIPQRIAEEAAA